MIRITSHSMKAYSTRITSRTPRGTGARNSGSSPSLGRVTRPSEHDDDEY